MSETAIKVNDVSKLYKLYDKPSDRFKEALGLTKEKKYKEHYALHNVSFDVKKGQTVGIIGTNGSGKSTILKIITGVLSATEGDVEVEGRISALLELGAGFNQEYTGMENIYLNGTMMGYTREEVDARVQMILDFADIGDFINQPVKSYSSGMFARLAFAVAINVEPDVLIVDEALSVGDIFFQNKCFRRIENLKEKGVTILYVSHDLASVKEMCDKALWLEHGQIKMYGDCTEVCNEYSNALLRNKDEMYSEESLGNTNDYYSRKKLSDVDWPELTYTNESILSDDVKIVSCFMSKEDGTYKNIFKPGETCVVSVVIDSKIDLKDAIVGFAMATVKGVWVINLNSLISADKKRIEIHSGKRVKVDFHFAMPALISGNYVIEAAVCNGTMTNYKTYTWLYNIMSVTVLNDAEQYALLNVESRIDIEEE